MRHAWMTVLLLTACEPDAAKNTVKPPAMPTEVTVTRKSAGEADVKWKATSSDEWGFRVERSTSDSGPWV